MSDTAPLPESRSSEGMAVRRGAENRRSRGGSWRKREVLFRNRLWPVRPCRISARSAKWRAPPGFRHAYTVMTGKPLAPAGVQRRHGRPAARCRTTCRTATCCAEFLGKPLTKIPDPFGTHESFGHHNNARLRGFLDSFGFQYEFGSSSDYYAAGTFRRRAEAHSGELRRGDRRGAADAGAGPPRHLRAAAAVPSADRRGDAGAYRSCGRRCRHDLLDRRCRQENSKPACMAAPRNASGRPIWAMRWYALGRGLRNVPART